MSMPVTSDGNCSYSASRTLFSRGFCLLLTLASLLLPTASWAARYQAVVQSPNSSGTAGEVRNVVLAFDDQWNYLTADFTILPSENGGVANGFWMVVSPANATGNAARSLTLYADLNTHQVSLYRLSGDPLNFAVDRNKDFLSSHANAVRVSDDETSGRRVVRIAVPLMAENGLGRFGAGGVSWQMQLLLDARFSYDANHHLLGVKSSAQSDSQVQAQPVARLNSPAEAPQLAGSKESPLWMLLFVFGLGGLIWVWRHPRYRRHVRQSEQRAAAAAAAAKVTTASVDAVESDRLIAAPKP